jgi:hypothetical protein
MKKVEDLAETSARGLTPAIVQNFHQLRDAITLDGMIE